MTIQLTPSFHQLAGDAEAGRRCMENLLNCYCREVARPQGRISTGSGPDAADAPLALRSGGHLSHGPLLRIDLPRTATRICVLVEEDSPTGSFRYQSDAYLKAGSHPWCICDWSELARRLLQELAADQRLPVNNELLAQIRESVAVTSAILQGHVPSPLPADPLAAYLRSEQGLTFGHPFHPAPKSRQGFTAQDLAAYSPENGARFALHFFAVRHENLLQDSLQEQTCDELIRRLCPDIPLPGTSYALAPVHPWQAAYLKTLPAVQQALADGRIRDLGRGGDDWFATSSIRTLFQPHRDFFLKLSLNVRITNCVRKNAVYELEGAVQITRILRAVSGELLGHFPYLRLMEEPAFQSVDLNSGDPDQDKAITEGFGLILRQGLEGLRDHGVTPLLAGALFGNREYGAEWMRRILDQHRHNTGLDREAAVEDWFSAYVEYVMHPVLYCYFRHGLIFEPHLQNVLLGLREGKPHTSFLRDFEGVKLQRDRYPESRLPGISPRAREALWYDEELGWRRIAYCLFVNNFAEAITQLARDGACGARLWQIVRRGLEGYLARWPSPAATRRLQEVLAGAPFPAKANLLNRVLKNPDRAVSYIDLPNPLAQKGGV